MRICRSSAVRCVSLPTPVTAQDISPGRAFARAINSGSVLMPSAGGTATNIGFSAVNPMAVKSRGTWIGRLAAAPGSDTNVDSTGM